VTQSDDESDVFRDAIRGVAPLKRDDRLPPRRKRPHARARQRRAADALALDESRGGRFEEYAAGEIAFRRSSIPARSLHRLRSGRYSIEAEIDLHGMTRADAESALKAFLLESIGDGLRCVRVVHGKGARSGPAGPVLKESVHRWLTMWDEVLAVASAQPRHGGNGAVYVLLKKHA
jgi:DNA-nicking Smr family endonuclease